VTGVETDKPTTLRQPAAPLHQEADARDAEARLCELADLLTEEEGAAAASLPGAARLCRGVKKNPLLIIEKLVKEYPRPGAHRTRKLFGRQAAAVEPDVFRAGSTKSHQFIDRPRR